MELKLFCAAAMMAATFLGCSVHAPAPRHAAAYDFSDSDYYDRSYAPSPEYGGGPTPLFLDATPAAPPPAAPPSRSATSRAP